MTTINGVAPRSQHEAAAAIRRIRDAADAVYSAKQGPLTGALAVANEDLRATVQAARDVGVSWQTIGNALGLRRGAAYQRFRHRSTGSRC